MTIGEKIKKARKEYGFSQEQLAEKLSVSRSAVAKWEAGNGMPDVDNLKAISELLDVSVDYLLSDGDSKEKSLIREEYNLSHYGKGSKTKKKNRVVRERFPNGEIYPLLGNRRLTKGEKAVDVMLGVFTDAPFGTAELIHSIRNSDKAFYLVEQDSKQFFVMVTDTFVETTRPCTPITGDKFEVDGFKFRKCKYRIK